MDRNVKLEVEQLTRELVVKQTKIERLEKEMTEIVRERNERVDWLTAEVERLEKEVSLWKQKVTLSSQQALDKHVAENARLTAEAKQLRDILRDRENEITRLRAAISECWWADAAKTLVRPGVCPVCRQPAGEPHLGICSVGRGLVVSQEVE